MFTIKTYIYILFVQRGEKMNTSIDFLKISKIILLFALIFSSVSIGFSQYASANTTDPLLEGKTEQEIEAEVNAYLEELEKSQDSTQPNAINSELQVAQPASAQQDCIVAHMGAAYADMFSTAAIVALYNDPSWAKFKNVAKQAIANGAKGSIVGIAYQLSKSHSACVGAGQIA